MRKVCMDGDEYLMTVPELLLVKHIWTNNKEAFRINSNAPLLLVSDSSDGSDLLHLRPFDTSGQYVYSVTASLGGDNMVTYMGHLDITDPSKQWYGLHPELIPLTKDGDLDPVLLSNPDGTIVTGGSLRFEKTCRSMPLRGQCPLVMDTTTIGNTVSSKPPMEWVCWAGRLVSRCPIGIASIPVAHALNYVAGGSDSLILQTLNRKFSPTLY